MAKEMVTVIIERCVQVGPNDFRVVRVARNFSVSRSLADILAWASSAGLENPTVNDLMFCQYSGASY